MSGETMTIFNLGSINVDHIYKLSHFPSSGETVPSVDYDIGLGGKGINQSIAAVNAGGTVVHIGSIGSESEWIMKMLQDLDLETRCIAFSDQKTGHAIIFLDENAENTIVLHPGANHDFQRLNIEKSLAQSQDGDWLLLQNETNLGYEAVNYARSRGLKIAYSAAPFDCQKTEELLPFCDLLVINEVEALQCKSSIENFDNLTCSMIFIITRGEMGATCYLNGETSTIPALSVPVVDTTGAGDTFLGFLLAAIDNGDELQSALKLATAAAAIQITRDGAVKAIPLLREVETFTF
jgi:ribokinase